MTDPVILIHGAWQGSWTFNALLPHLDEVGFTGIAVDLPGNGTDDTDPADVSLDLYLNMLESVIDAHGRASPHRWSLLGRDHRYGTR